MKPQKHRVIMRIEVSGSVPGAIENSMDQFGATHISIFSRVIDWVCKQDAETQATILGLMPKGFEIDPVRKTFEAMARQKKR
jgi:hypothetical protein